MLPQLLQQYFNGLPQNPDPHFQRPFKTWINMTHASQLDCIRHWVAQVGNDWPSQQEVDALCQLVRKTFQTQDWPIAFGHLILTLAPCYDEQGNQWAENYDPIRLPPENVGRFFGYVQSYLQQQITLATAGNDEEKQRQFKATGAALEKGPPAKGVILFGEGENRRVEVHQARAVAIPYDPFPQPAVPPLQPINFKPDGDCIESMQTAARECVAKLRDVGRGELIKTVLGGPFDFRVSEVLKDFIGVEMVLGGLFGRETTKPTPSFKEVDDDEKLRFLSLVLVLMGVFFYFSFALGGGGWLYGLNLFLLPLPRTFLFGGFVAACVCLGGGLLLSLLWSGIQSVLPLKQNRTETPNTFYFLVSVEQTDETPYDKDLKDISLGLTFFCAFVGAVVPFLQRPPAWARRLVELMKASSAGSSRGRLVACAGLRKKTGEKLQQVEVEGKLNAIQKDNGVTVGVFSLLNCGEVFAAWPWKRARLFPRTKAKCFRGKETTRGIWVFGFETLEPMISRLLTPYQWHRTALRVLILFLLLLAFTFDQTPSPTLSLEVQSKDGKLLPQYQTADMIRIQDLLPGEQGTLNIRVDPPILWPFKLKVESEKRMLFEAGESQRVIERWVWSQTPVKVDFHMPRDESRVLVAVIVQDLLKRRDNHTVQLLSPFR